MKTLTPLELLTSISIFANDANIKLAQSLRNVIVEELEKDPHYLELKKLIDDVLEHALEEGSYDEGSLNELHENLWSYENSNQKIISTIVTIQRNISITETPNKLPFFGADKLTIGLVAEEVMVTGTIAELIKILNYLGFNTRRYLTGKKLIIEITS
ncbi:TPA: hypothetical protein ACUNCG_000432 [Aeromonas hydrophila]